MLPNTAAMLVLIVALVSQVHSAVKLAGRQDDVSNDIDDDEDTDDAGAVSQLGEFVELKNFTAEDIKNILKYHNVYRNFVASGSETRGPQPAAENMLQLEWSNVAQIKASSLARKCLLEHEEHTTQVEEILDGINHTNVRPLGQNIGFQSSSFSTSEIDVDGFFELSIKKLITDWYEEVENVTFAEPFRPEIGHYRQMIWASTEQVGCAASLCRGEGKLLTNVFLVCDYFPKGNKEGSTAYEPGNLNCAKYNLHNSHFFPALCTKFGSLIISEDTGPLETFRSLAARCWHPVDILSLILISAALHLLLWRCS